MLTWLLILKFDNFGLFRNKSVFRLGNSNLNLFEKKPFFFIGALNAAWEF